MCPCPSHGNPIPHLRIARIPRLGLRPDRLRLVAQEDPTVLMARFQTTQGIGELAVAEDKSVETVLQVLKDQWGYLVATAL